MRFQIFISTVAAICINGVFASASPIKSAAGLDLGGNATFMFSDPSLQAFGVGAGYQGSLFLTMWNERPIGGKMRLETVSLREEAVQKIRTNYAYPDSHLKSMVQNWTLLSFGAEGRFQGHGQILFWEALLGYAFGGGANVTVSRSVDQGITDTSQTTNSGFALSGGVGIKRTFTPKITGLMSLRSMLFMAAPYSSNGLANKSFIPLPFFFSVGAEMPFDLF
ncbi:MAG: hypothetical protein SGI74_13505 [Oligoflexia bacterium]|nr:hypothetical protein [Oligoflexia bacterium]